MQKKIYKAFKDALTKRVKTCRCFAGYGLLWQIERRWVHMANRKHPEWIPRDGHAWPGRAGLDLWGGGLWSSCTSSWTERERQKDDRERPPGADRCSPPLQLRPHSWPGSGDRSLPLPPCVRPLTPSEPHALTLKSCTRPDTGTRPARYSSFSLVNLWSTLHRSQHCLKIQTSTLSKHQRRLPSCILLQMLVITRWTAAEPLEDTGSRQTTFYEQEVAKLFLPEVISKGINSAEASRI